MSSDASRPVAGLQLPADLAKWQGEPDGNVKDTVRSDAPSRRVMGPTMPPAHQDGPGVSSATQAFLDREKRMREAAEVCRMSGAKEERRTDLQADKRRSFRSEKQLDCRLRRKRQADRTGC